MVVEEVLPVDEVFEDCGEVEGGGGGGGGG